MQDQPSPSSAKKHPAIIPVIMCGGTGKRLWPLSRMNFPKQFITLPDGQSLLDKTLGRVGGLSSRVIVLTGDAYRFMVQDALMRQRMKGDVILEPCARNTAPAMALACLQAQPDDVLLFCPADHHIGDDGYFRERVAQAAFDARQGHIVLFGIKPDHPATGYGYIQPGDRVESGNHMVASFIEKPDAAKAGALLAEGAALWNAGIFLAQAKIMLSAMEKHCPDIPALAKKAFAKHETTSGEDGIQFILPDRDSFAAIESQSIDYAVIEKADGFIVSPLDIQWSDIGNWQAMRRQFPQDQNGNHVHGDAVAQDAKGNFIYSPDKLTVALGVENMLIVNLPDCLLVADLNKAESVKQVVEHLEAAQRSEAIEHNWSARPWGKFTNLYEMAGQYKVKKLYLEPKSKISLQSHKHRSEHWVVVEGAAVVTRNDDEIRLQKGESIFIEKGDIHRLANEEDRPLVVIEVQVGEYLEEDDIRRFEDHYGRK